MKPAQVQALRERIARAAAPSSTQTGLPAAAYKTTDYSRNIWIVRAVVIVLLIVGLAWVF